MQVILFFALAFFSIFLSVKISIYADNLSNSSRFNSGIIGGVFLAGVTSLPELITCISSVKIGNPYLAVGDILGSNVFNIFIICFFDLVFLKQMIFNKTCFKKHKLIYFLSLINYVVIVLAMFNIINSSFFNLGVPSVIIFITYIYYLICVYKNKESDGRVVPQTIYKHLGAKVLLTCIFLVISSILLTIVVNNIALNNSRFSSSLIGAVLLGITTSLPEVVSYYTLIVIKNYDLALSNIIGSNFFNLFVLSIGDLVLDANIYNFTDSKSYILILLVSFFTIISLLQNIKSSNRYNFLYFIPSLIIVTLYLLFWGVNFIH